jgi:hypothetical protein
VFAHDAVDSSLGVAVGTFQGTDGEDHEHREDGPVDQEHGVLLSVRRRLCRRGSPWPRVHILPVMPHSATDQMSSIRAAVPSAQRPS